MHSGLEFQKVREIISNVIGIPQEEIGEDTGLTGELYADSMEIFQILVEAEKEFDMKFTLDGIEKIRTAGDILRLLEES